MEKVKIFSKKYRLIIILFLILTLLVFLKISSPKKEELQVVQTVPNSLEKEVNPKTKIIFVFNQKIPQQQWEIKTSPEFEFNTLFSNQKIEITPKFPLNTNTTYQINISHPQIPSFSYSLVFSTLTIISQPTLEPSPPVTPIIGIGDPDFYLKIQEEKTKFYPLADFLPYETPQWRIPGYADKLTLIVIIKQDTLEIRQEVLDWIHSKKVDPSTHKIKWIVRP